MTSKILLAVILTASAFTLAVADVPGLINFQGILTDASAVPLANDTNSVEFRIYDSFVEGSTLWAETLIVITDSQGRFNVSLGQNNPIQYTVFNDTTRFLGVKVGADAELVPRTRLLSVAYSQRVGTLDGADGGNVYGNTLIKGAGLNDEIALGVGDPNVALEMRSGTFGGDPYIDFSNDNASDFDARIQLNGNKGLEITVDSVLTIPTGKVGIGTTAPSTELHVEGSVHATGNFTKDYTVGFPDLAAPIAYAFINSDGSVASGTSNVSSVWNAVNERYEITISGESYSATSFVTVVTPRVGASPEALFATTNSGSGNLLIRVMSSSTGTTGLQEDFQFITYKP